MIFREQLPMQKQTEKRNIAAYSKMKVSSLRKQINLDARAIVRLKDACRKTTIRCEVLSRIRCICRVEVCHEE